MSPAPDQREGLELDIDVRLAHLWAVIFQEESVLAPVVEDDDMRSALGAVLRQAYAEGYVHALAEDRNGRRGELARANGYAHP